MRCGPRPAAGNIPIWVGGISRRAIRRAVELGDGWHGTRMNPDQVAERIGWIREVAARRGRNLDGFSISHRGYLGFPPKWTDTGRYVEGVRAPPPQNSASPNPFAARGANELLINPLDSDP